MKENQRMVELALLIIKRREPNTPAAYRLKFADNLRICARCGKIRLDHFTSGSMGQYFDVCNSNDSLEVNVAEERKFKEDPDKSKLLLAMIRMMQ